jgi:tetratricopeptide (TPR) repeat protein
MSWQFLGGRSDEEYLLLLEELLDRLVEERSYSTLINWSLERGVEEEELVVWLRGVAGKISEDLRNRLGWLTGLGQGELTVVAEEIWRVDSLIDVASESINSDDAEMWFDRGNSLSREERHEKAVISFDSAIYLKPDYYKAFYDRGVSLGNLSRHEEAIVSFDSAITGKPDYHEAFYGRGISLYVLGKYEEAIKSYKRAIFFKSDYHEAFYGQGISQGILGRHEEAIASFDSAITGKPDYHEAFHGRGISLGNLGRHEEAIASFDSAISFKSNYHEYFYCRGNSLYALGKYEEAITSYERAISSKHDYYAAWYSRGNSLYALGKYEEAITSFECAISFKHDYHEAWCNRGNSLYALKRHEEAITSYESAISFKHDSYEAWCNRGHSLHGLRRFGEAIESYDSAIFFKHDYHEAWSSRGGALNDLGRYEDAITSCDHAIFFKHDSYEALYNRGNSLRTLSRYEDAIKSYDSAISFKHNYHEAWCNRGNSLHNLGRYKEAIISCERAISSKKDNHHAWCNRGNSLDNLGRYDDAIKNYQQGLCHFQSTTHPDGWGELHLGLGRSHYLKGRNNFDKFPLDSRVYYRKALAAFQEAANAISESSELYLELIQDFMKVYSALQDVDQADSYRTQGRELLEQLLNDKSPLQRRKLQAKFNSFRQLEVDILIQQHKPDLALKAADLCKNLCLESLLDALQENIVSPSFSQIQTLLQPRSAIVYWHLSPTALSTFILQPDDIEPTTFCNCNLTELQDWITQWDNFNVIPVNPLTIDNTKKSHDSPIDYAPIFAQLDWPKLHSILEIDKIQQHLKNPSNLILIPHKDLHRLPLHQFFSQPVIYLPSLQTALNLQHKNQPNHQQKLTLDLFYPPTGSKLSGGEVEAGIIAQIFPPDRAKSSDEVTKANFLGTLNNAAPHSNRIFHFTGHGQHFARRPLESCLYLVDNETITCKEIASINLQPYHLVILSACQTAIVHHQKLEDEYVGLVSACLSAGASYTISALWSINDKESSPLFIYFYQQLAQNIPAPQALHKASQWLRHVTNSELYEFYAALPEHTDTNIQEAIRIKKIKAQAEPADRPYQNPYYWAAFTISGITPELE